MGKRGKNWFVAVKKVFSPESKKNKGEKSKKWGFRKSRNPCFPEKSQNIVPDVASPPPLPVLPSEEIKLAEVEKEQNKHAYSVAISSVAAAEAQAAEVARLTSSTMLPNKSREEVAAITIQTAFRGYLARRALRALRGLVRLKLLIHRNTVKRQATTTLRCMQTLARVQSQIRSRRIKMLEENQTLQRQLLLKHERELESIRISEGWDDSMQSKEQIETSFLSKQEAAMRRERALAYAFSHQWKNPSSSVNPTFMHPNNPQWGWSWLERWMSSRPCENRSSTADKDLNSDRASTKTNTGGQIIKAYTHRDGNLDRAMRCTPRRSRPVPPHQSPATPPFMVLTVNGKVKSASPRNGWHPSDDDTKSMLSIQSERPRRHSIAGSSIRDDESLASSPAIPSYMAPTESARAKNRFHSRLSDIKIETAADKGSAGSVKKRLSFTASPTAARRHSGPPRVEGSVAVKEMSVKSEQNASNVEIK